MCFDIMYTSCSIILHVRRGCIMLHYDMTMMYMLYICTSMLWHDVDSYYYSSTCRNIMLHSLRLYECNTTWCDMSQHVVVECSYVTQRNNIEDVTFLHVLHYSYVKNQCQLSLHSLTVVVHMYLTFRLF